MEQVAWTAIGLLEATLFGSIFWLGSRIDNLSSRLDAGFGRLDARIDGVNSRLDGVNARLDEHLRTHTSHP